MLDQHKMTRRKIAIVGGGISGLSAAYELSAHHDVTVYEANHRLGGHARTVLAGKNGDQPVDTGFIVFNYVTYPYLTRLFQKLDVPTIRADMSFGASIDNGRLEYGLNSVRAVAAQKRNLLRPQFYKMLIDIVRFSKRAEAAASDDDISIGELVDKLGLGQWFRNNYLMPMCGAIWSTPVAEIDQFPAKSLVRFFRNHALLAGLGKHQWWTVQGGSIEYIKRLQSALIARGVTLYPGTAVTAVKRTPLAVMLTTPGGTDKTYDDVILACHSDQALTLLGDGASRAEKQALSAIRYQTNKAVLHCDDAQMPKRKAAWSSWAYRAQDGKIGVTYWMNKLQNIPDSDPMFVTLNPSRDIAADKIYDQVCFAHPVFDKPALRAQQQLRAMQGRNRTWFAGAYHRHGFHEDGIASAMRVVRLLNCDRSLKGNEFAFDQQSPEIGVSVHL